MHEPVMVVEIRKEYQHKGDMHLVTLEAREDGKQPQSVVFALTERQLEFLRLFVKQG